MQTLSPLDSTYRHTPLTKPHSIRLLSLKPIPDESLTFELIETSLSHLPKYEALSYAWDAQRPECPILCNGKSQFVTANCRAALLRLRQPSERLLWLVYVFDSVEAFTDQGKGLIRYASIRPRKKSSVAKSLLWVRYTQRLVQSSYGLGNRLPNRRWQSNF
jgi:hypothetical protein